MKNAKKNNTKTTVDVCPCPQFFLPLTVLSDKCTVCMYTYLYVYNVYSPRGSYLLWIQCIPSHQNPVGLMWICVSFWICEKMCANIFGWIPKLFEIPYVGFSIANSFWKRMDSNACMVFMDILNMILTNEWKWSQFARIPCGTWTNTFKKAFICS